ncbi:MAG: DUF5318 family protein [Nitriliruptoraceae bacterium]|nr:DUF5318 family protein [Nitriliruptoraceae bacterium]
MRQGRTDYRLQRRGVLRAYREGARSREDVCDAHPDLVRAGIHIGTEVRDDCPICEDHALRQVDYVFERKGRRSTGGRAVPRESLTRQAERFGDLEVYRVEVCVRCHWHHLVESFHLLARGTAVG